MRRALLLPALFLLLAVPRPGTAAEEEIWRADVASRFADPTTIEVPVLEISGLAVLPGGDASRTSLLAVTDEGPYDVERKVIDGALYRVDLGFGEEGGRVERVLPIALHVAFERFDRGWPATVSPLDLEGAARVPGRDDLFLLSGERNPEDQTDDGANRLYLVRYPAGDEGRADVVRYYRICDLAGDSMNDRFEGIAVLPARTDATDGRLRVYAFKERVGSTTVVPGYVRGRLDPVTFDLVLDDDRGYPPLPARRLTDANTTVSSQSDALATPDGEIWVLDRWRREIHVAEIERADDTLRLVGHLDLFDVVKEVPGERDPGPWPPGRAARIGYGRHEALALDAAGRLLLGADRGGGRPSTITVLRPRKSAEAR